MSALLELRGVSVFYGRVPAVQEVAFTVREGGLSTIIGANGAGKSSVLNAIAGLVPCRGPILYQGRDLRWDEPEDRVARGLCLVPEHRALFGSMSVAENLALGGFLHRRDGPDQAARLRGVFRRFPRLEERRDQAAATLSGGERQMLAIGRAMMGRPRLLLLDEPSLGLAPLLVQEMFRAIAELRADGVSILLVEQNARAALEAADEAQVMESGQIRLQGPAAELLRDPRVAEIYLGGGVGGEDVRV